MNHFFRPSVVKKKIHLLLFFALLFATLGSANVAAQSFIGLFNDATATNIPDGDNMPTVLKGTDFESVEVGNSATSTFEITNQFYDGSIVNISISIDNATDFMVTQASPDFISPSETTTFTVAFNPQSAGTKTAIVTVDHQTNDGFGNFEDYSHTFTVTGEGTEASCDFYLPSNVLDFDGVDDRIEFGAFSFYQNSFTIEGWMNSTDAAGGAMVLHITDGTGTAISMQRIGNTLGVTVRAPAGTSGGLSMNSTTDVWDGNWHHFALAKGDNDRFKLYIDGVVEAEPTNPVPDFTNVYDVILSFSTNSSPRYFDGQMDEIRFWSDERSQGEIVAHKDIELTGNEDHLAAYYNFNQGIPDGDNTGELTLIDRTSNGHDGTLVNFTDLTGTESNWTAPAPVGNSSMPVLFNDGPKCAGEDITFSASPGAANYEFFADANMNGEVDGGESLQNSSSNTYTTNTLSDGDIISVLVTDQATCTAVATSTVSLDAFFLPSNVLDFDGLDDVVNLGNYSFYQNSFTMEGWFNTPNTHTGLMIHVRPDDVRTALSIQVLGSGKLLATVRNTPNNAGGFGLLSTSDVTDGQWHHFALVKEDDDKFKLYIDGVLESSPNNIAFDFVDTYEILLGFNVTGSPRYYDGQMDEVRFWNVARSQDDILATKDKELTGTENNLVAYYNFNQGVGGGDNTGVTTLLDGTANNHDGTLQNFAVFGNESNWIANQPFGQSDLLRNDGPACFGAPIQFTALLGASNYEFFADANMNGQVDGGESLQDGPSNAYTSSTLNDGDIISLLLTDVDGCTALATSAVVVNTCGPGDFITRWKVTNSDRSIIIPTNTNEYTYDYTVDWGDGTVEMNQTGNATHTYAQAGEYIVTISGTFPHFFLNGDDNTTPNKNHLKLTALVQWGNQQWKSMDSAFESARNMFYQAQDAPDLSMVTDCERMFYFTQNFGSPDLTNWDVSNVQNMIALFQGSNFNGNVSNWQTGNVTTMQELFAVSDFNGDVSLWNTSQVTHLFRTFRGCPFNGNISAWNVGNVISTTEMLWDNEVFNQDISGWQFTQLEDTERMFRNAKSFNQNIGGWNMSTVIDAQEMFFEASAFNQDLSGWNVSSMENMSNMFAHVPLFNSDISGWQTANVKKMGGMFFHASSFDQDLSSWDVTSLEPGLSLWPTFTGSAISLTNYDAILNGWGAQEVADGIQVGAHGLQYCAGKDMRQHLIDEHGWIFIGDELDAEGCPADLSSFITSWQTSSQSPTVTIVVRSILGFPFNFTVDWGDGNIDENVAATITHTYTNHSQPQTVSISGQFPRFYAYTASDLSNAKRLLDVKQWGTNQWRTMNYAFARASNLSGFSASDSPDLSQVRDMGAMFADASSFNGDLTNWDVSNVTNMAACFRNTDNFNGDLDRWDVSKVKLMNTMFEGATSFNQFIDSWDVSNVEDMRSMFSLAKNFNQDLNSWDTKKVMDMRYMFYRASAFNQDIGAWNTANVSNMFSMFSNASAFNQNLGNWDIGSLFNGFSMLSNSGLDQTNYDNTLIGWGAQVNNLNPNVTIGAHGLTYCNGENARNTLITNKNWTFNGDTKCPSPNDLTEDEDNIESILANPNATTEPSVLDNKELILFPNPAKETLTLIIKAAQDQPKTIELSNQLGVVCWSQTLEAPQQEINLDLSQQRFAPGLYWVNLYMGDEVVTEKLIVVK